MVTQRDIAQRLGVSQSAVACAFSEKLKDQISEENRALILQTARDMGYVPNRAGRRLALARSSQQARTFDQVGMLYVGREEADGRPSAFSDRVFLEILQGAEQVLSDQDVSLTFTRIRGEADWRKVARLVQSGGIDGWLAYGPIADAAAERMSHGDMPWVVLGDHICSRPVACVTIDHAGMARRAVEKLAELGHRRIAIVGGTMSMHYQQLILQGYEAARHSLGLDTAPELVLNHLTWPEHDDESLDRRLRRMSQMPTAVIATEHSMATTRVDHLSACGLRVPDDISIIGFELLIGAATVDDRISRFELPMLDVGKLGAQLLANLAAGKGAPGPAEPGPRMLIEPAFVAGETLGPPPAL